MNSDRRTENRPFVSDSLRKQGFGKTSCMGLRITPRLDGLEDCCPYWQPFSAFTLPRNVSLRATSANRAGQVAYCGETVTGAIAKNPPVTKAGLVYAYMKERVDTEHPDAFGYGC